MKLTAIIILTACLSVSAKSYSQNVTLSMKEVSLERVFSEIRKQTGYDFFYSSATLKNAKKININVKETSLQEVLDLCFANQPFTYTIADKTIIIKQTVKGSNGEKK